MAVQALSTVAASSNCSDQLNHRVPNSSLWTRNPLELQILHSQWVGTPIKISFQSKIFKPFVTKRCPIKANLSLSLPSSKPETAVSLEKIPKWSSLAIKAFALAELEAKKHKYTTTGTEGLLMGILIDGTNFASKYLRANNITLSKVREESKNVVGEPYMILKVPDHPPLTEEAQKALDWALDEKLKSGDEGEITTGHMLLGVWAQKGSPGYEILSTLGFNDEKAEELMNLISQPGFVED